MNRLPLIIVGVFSVIGFLVIANVVPGFGQPNQSVEKKVKIKLVFTQGGWEPEDKGMGNEPNNEPDKWVRQDRAPEGSELLLDEQIQVYKKNPCTVCVGGMCYVKKKLLISKQSVQGYSACFSALWLKLMRSEGEKREAAVGPSW